MSFKIRFRQKDFLVIEIGNVNLKAAFFSRGVARLKVENIWTKDITGLTGGEKAEEVEALIKGNFTSPQSSDLKVFFVVSETSLIVRRLTIPAIPRPEITDALKFQLKEEIFWDIDKTFYNWKVVQERVAADGTRKLDLIVSIVLRSKAEWILSLCKKMGVECHGVYSQLFSLSDFFRAAKAQEVFVVLDVGATSVNFMIFKAHVPVFVRRISLGSNQLTYAIMTFLKESSVSFEEAEKMKKDYGLLDGGREITRGIMPHDLVSSMRALIEKLVREIRSSIEYYNSEFEEVKIDRIYFLGGGAQLKKLNSILGEELNLRVARFPLLKETEINNKLDRDEASVYLPVLLGAVLAKEGNFLPRKLRPSAWGDGVALMVKAGAPLAALVAFLLFLQVMLQRQQFQAKFDYTKSNLGTFETIKRLRQEINEHSLIFNRLKTKYVPIDWIMKNLSNFLPPQAMLDRLIFDSSQNVIFLEGQVIDTINAEKILTTYSQEMRKMEIFDDVDIVHILSARGAERAVQFKLNCRLVKLK